MFIAASARLLVAWTAGELDSAGMCRARMPAHRDSVPGVDLILDGEIDIRECRQEGAHRIPSRPRYPKSGAGVHAATRARARAVDLCPALGTDRARRTAYDDRTLRGVVSTCYGNKWRAIRTSGMTGPHSAIIVALDRESSAVGYARTAHDEGDDPRATSGSSDGRPRN
jgi:hypothetical protein